MFALNIGNGTVFIKEMNGNTLVNFDDVTTPSTVMEGAFKGVDVQNKPDINSTFFTIFTLTPKHQLRLTTWMKSEGTSHHRSFETDVVETLTEEMGSFTLDLDSEKLTLEVIFRPKGKDSLSLATLSLL
tara:strand:+ start:20 stop:406 length:387 start_codon:yes stop_codon:yes gene_type:complete